MTFVQYMAPLLIGLAAGTALSGLLFRFKIPVFLPYMARLAIVIPLTFLAYSTPASLVASFPHAPWILKFIFGVVVGMMSFTRPKSVAAGQPA